MSKQETQEKEKEKEIKEKETQEKEIKEKETNQAELVRLFNAHYNRKILCTRQDTHNCCLLYTQLNVYLQQITTQELQNNNLEEFIKIIFSHIHYQTSSYTPICTYFIKSCELLCSKINILEYKNIINIIINTIYKKSYLYNIIEIIINNPQVVYFPTNFITNYSNLYLRINSTTTNLILLNKILDKLDLQNQKELILVFAPTRIHLLHKRLSEQIDSNRINLNNSDLEIKVRQALLTSLPYSQPTLVSLNIKLDTQDIMTIIRYINNREYQSNTPDTQYILDTIHILDFVLNYSKIILIRGHMRHIISSSTNLMYLIPSLVSHGYIITKEDVILSIQYNKEILDNSLILDQDVYNACINHMYFPNNYIFKCKEFDIKKYNLYKMCCNNSNLTKSNYTGKMISTYIIENTIEVDCNCVKLLLLKRRESILETLLDLPEEYSYLFEVTRETIDFAIDNSLNNNIFKKLVDNYDKCNELKYKLLEIKNNKLKKMLEDKENEIKKLNNIQEIKKVKVDNLEVIKEKDKIDKEVKIIKEDKEDNLEDMQELIDEFLD
jgi:hypothetical protein